MNKDILKFHLQYNSNRLHIEFQIHLCIFCAYLILIILFSNKIIPRKYIYTRLKSNTHNNSKAIGKLELNFLKDNDRLIDY